MIKVSVIIPSYNVRPYIKQCLDSVKKQSLSNIEIICVDAGSTDGTAEEIAKIAEDDERIRFVRSDIKSYGYQVNFGLSLANGEYSAIVESDDYIAEDMYEVLFDIGWSMGADIIKADYQRIMSAGAATRKIHVPLLRKNEYYNKILKLRELDSSGKETIFDLDCNIWSGIYKTKFLRKNKILCNETPGASFQDIGFVLQALSLAESMYYVDRPMYQYRYMREGSSTLNPEVLRFVYQEVKFLLDKENVKKSGHFPLVMRRLSRIFLHEFGRMSAKYDFTVLEKDYRRIRPFFEQYSTDEWEFAMLMAHPATYSVFLSRVINRREEWESSIVERWGNRDIVIVGYGKRGRYLETFCKALGVEVKSRCDNGHIAGVLSVEECCKTYPHAYFVITSKFYALSLQRQLQTLGVALGQMEIFHPLEHFIFYGAGKIGKKCGSFFLKHTLEPICYLDRDTGRTGEYIGRVPILNATEFLDTEGEGVANGASILITMAKRGDEVRDKLVARGIEHTKIYRYENRMEFFNFALLRLVGHSHDVKYKDNKTGDSIYFDLGNGVVLGGVESWSVDMGNYLKTIGRHVKYVSGCYETDIYNMAVDEVIGLIEEDEFRDIEHCLMVASEMLCDNKFVYVCNFNNPILYMVIWMKSRYHMNIKLIAVVHNDTEEYYETYEKYVDYIDVILYMSIKQKKALLDHRIPDNKLKYLGWNIPCEEALNRRWSKTGERLKIGYAGRLVQPQKRTDLLLRLMVVLLKEKDMDICFTIAGDGIYRKEMESELRCLGLLGRVFFLGQLSKDDMLPFWYKQDIMVSCSDWEGNSISKSEAMAAGVVPVVTDTSGAADDIDHGINGYIVPVGDIYNMAEHIRHLYQHRELLPKLGKAAHERILMNNRNYSVEKLWEELL